MPKVVGYHRPSSVDEALDLLARPGTAVLAGGTVLNADRGGEPVVAVDVQRLGLGGVTSSGDGRIRVGATTTLQQFADDPSVPEGLRGLARHELPSALRTLATVGGTGRRRRLVQRTAGRAARARHAHRVRRGGIRAGFARGRADRADRLAGRLVVAVEFSTGGVFADALTGRAPG